MKIMQRNGIQVDARWAVDEFSAKCAIITRYYWCDILSLQDALVTN
jgi:hypothetical protein